ncbi:hypothetical protein C3729_10275 [Cloacibacterium normanense]|uniref:Lipoprotein n=1 Tax=Cloacibacterium normanense TaxID=237258 RepID=A0A2S7I384_9FLAO|nr:hypothetical protein [Cloacibacterium normanense]PPZ91052.1 hypothetical protein C3729_10275 [Cloacibacterium normanense]
MKKLVFAVAAASFLVSCGLPEGGNKGVLKKTEDVVRYDDENAEAPTYKEKTDSATVVEQPAAAEVKVDSTAKK